MESTDRWNDLADNVADRADDLAQTVAGATRKAARTKSAKKMSGASQRVEGAVHERVANALFRSIFLGAAAATAIASLGLLVGNRKHESIYVGQWVPTLVLVALWAQVVKNA